MPLGSPPGAVSFTAAQPTSILVLYISLDICAENVDWPVGVGALEVNLLVCGIGSGGCDAHSLPELTGNSAELSTVLRSWNSGLGNCKGAFLYLNRVLPSLLTA